MAYARAFTADQVRAIRKEWPLLVGHDSKGNERLATGAGARLESQYKKSLTAIRKVAHKITYTDIQDAL